MYNEPPKKYIIYDLPTYKLILELKTENLDRFMNIVPIIGAFHQQMSSIYVISGISDILVLPCVIVEGSVDQPLKGEHYRQGLRCIML